MNFETHHFSVFVHRCVWSLRLRVSAEVFCFKPVVKSKMVSIALISVLLSCLFACEKREKISITVLDAQSRLPIDSVKVELRAGKNGDYTKNHGIGFTDSTGRFESSMMIGCAFGCYDIYIDYSKDGYISKTEFNHTEGTVELSQ